ncbi:TetR/AcrR family transcriptional regulator C-terminal domain-containing protein [Streptomyces sp. NPDC046324]|uniref:TetR/AcrR family transcriptional regulator n=1 Tax=Streptomyces sp. NPDC046324 TaxID=3154915 RepID=UPI0033DAF626
MESRGRRVGRPRRLSREAILRSAERILMEEGAEHLSMRRLAKDMSSTPMALYHHVKGKDELLLLLLEVRTERLPREELPREPRERLLAGARSLHEMLADCPWAVDALTPDDRVSTPTRRIVESMIDAAVACGLSHEKALYAYRVIWYYTLGELLVRFSRERARRQGGSTPWERAVLSLDPDAYPLLAGLGGQLTERAGTGHYQRGLEAVVDGLLRQGVA